MGLVEYGSGSEEEGSNEKLNGSTAPQRLVAKPSSSRTLSGVRFNQSKAAPSRKSPSPPVYSASCEPEAGPSHLADEHVSPRAQEKRPWGLARFGVPEPDSEAECNPDVEARFAGFHAAREANGESFNSILMRNKMFRNPRILDKLVSFIDVNDRGSNFGSMWDRKVMLTEGSAKAIGAEQRRVEEEREKAKAPGKRSAIDFAPASSKKPTPSSSKWNSQSTQSKHDRDGHRDIGRDDRDRHKSRRRSHSPQGSRHSSSSYR